jgi:hypothetical protein
MELIAETRTINEIFSQARKYVVPRFQREYSWTEEQIVELWEDVTDQISQDVDGNVVHDEYFIGSVVFVGEDSKPEHLIVDGQQRLITLTLLVKAIVERLRELGDVSAAKATHSNMIEGVDNDGRPYFKLINESPKPYFQNETQALNPAGLNVATTEEEKRLKATLDFFKNRLNGYKIGSIQAMDVEKSVRSQVLNYLKVIQVTAKSEDDAYTIFETLNARGLSLTSVDLVKNWIFKNYDQTHPNDNAKDIWGTLRKRVSSFSTPEVFFRHYWNSKYAFASDGRIYKSFKKLLKRGVILPAKDLLLEIDQSSKNYEKIGAPKDSDWPVQKEKSVKRAFDLLNQYRVTQPRPFLLALMDMRDKKLVGQTDFIRMIDSIERFHFIFSNLCKERASGLEGKYARAAKSLYAAGSNKSTVKTVLTDLTVYLANKRPDEKRIKNSLKSISYGVSSGLDNKVIQAVFSKIELYLHKTSELSIGSLSIEHVRDRSSRATWVDSIANLIPLDEGLNNSIPGGISFDTKKSYYSRSQLKIVEEFLRQNSQSTWDLEDAERWVDTLTGLVDKATAIR